MGELYGESISELDYENLLDYEKMIVTYKRIADFLKDNYQSGLRLRDYIIGEN